MFSSKDEWPSDYNRTLADHIHAIGVIALRFSQFEACLRDLYLRLASGNHDDLENIDQEYLKPNDGKRAKAIRKQAKQFAENADLIACSVDNLMDFFERCRISRNIILHSEIYSALFNDNSSLLFLRNYLANKTKSAVTNTSL